MHDTTRPRRPGEAVFAIVLLLISLVVLHQSYGLAGLTSLTGANVFPMLAGATMLAAMIAVLWGLRPLHRAVAEAVPEPGAEAASWTTRFVREVLPLTVVVLVALMVAYMLALEPLGFLPSSLAFLFLSIWYLHRGNILFVATVSIGALAAIYVVFRYVFSVLLP
ncbi:MAG TPA: tripartite tricarboxylate transporter TctB family protein [Geminicoccaceae bacterium]|nr:tripartite tricarboxylate transporter TctB family protein [Geminicoccaceae bacterium]